MGAFHKEEETTIWILMSYENEHPHTRYILTYPSGESYLCSFDTAFDDENIEEQEEYGAEVDEYDTLLYHIERVIRPGNRIDPIVFPDGTTAKRELLAVMYRDMPALVTTEDGEQIYPPVS